MDQQHVQRAFGVRVALGDLALQRHAHVLGQQHDVLLAPADVGDRLEHVAQVADRHAFLGQPALLHALVARLNADGQIAGGQRMVSHGDRAPKLTQAQRRNKQQVIDSIREAGLTPPTRKELAKLLGTGEAALRPIIELAVLEGELVHLEQDMYLHVDSEPTLREKVAAIDGIATAGVTVSQAREALGVSRKYAIPLVVYLDRVGVTRKEGDLRFLAEGSDVPINPGAE